MTLNGWLQILFFLLAIFLVTPLIGGYMARVFTRQRTWLDPVLRPVERLVYRLTGVDETREMRWTEYAVALLLFSVVSMLVLYAMQRLQQVLPFNPQGFGAVAPELAFNTAASFTTNTNWQAYSGEIDDELFHADGRPRLSQLRVGGGRHLGRHRVHPRHRAEGEGHASATSGWTWCARRSGCCCRSRSSARCSWSRRAWCRTSSRTTRSR